MKKQIYILNGMGGCGKDTFAELLGEVCTVSKYSSVDRVKQIAYECGWNGGKTEKDRKFLSDLKCLLSDYNDLPYDDVTKRTLDFMCDEEANVMLIDIREPADIRRAADAYNAKTILIKNDRVPFISTNMADANVYNYAYDFVIENNGTIEEYREKVRKFAKENIFNGR